jgi:DNA-binding PadR family transcriptional regulator
LRECFDDSNSWRKAVELTNNGLIVLLLIRLLEPTYQYKIYLEAPNHTGVKLAQSSISTILYRLYDAGYIEPTDPDTVLVDWKVYYRVTQQGLEAAQKAMSSLVRIYNLAEEADIFD